MLEEIIAYMQQSPRNKLIISQKKLGGLKYLDVGLDLAKVLTEIPISKHFSLRAKSSFAKIIEAAELDHTVLGKILALENLGVLLESELKFNLEDFLENASKDKVVFLKWEGEIISKDLFFLSRKSGIKINIENLSHIVI